MRDKIIDYIKRNRVSSTQVADCLGKSGSIKNTKIVNYGHFRVGTVHYVYAIHGTNYDVHKQIEHIDDGSIVFVDVINNEGKAVFGDLVSKFLLLYRQASAIVTNGMLRDAPMLIRERWPIWCNGFTPEGFVNTKVTITPDERDLIESRKAFYEGSIAVCDDTGVTIIPKDLFNETMLDRLISIEEQEDIWFDCIDRRKYTTFETVCERKYEIK